MIVNHIFNWADRAPDKTAMIYNGQPWTYGVFARLIAISRGYFVSRGCFGDGTAVLAVSNVRDFWILSLALRSLGLTTVAVGSADAIEGLGLSDIRCVVSTADESWPNLQAICARRGLELLNVSPAGQVPVALDAGPQPARPGGHIMLTSGTTGDNKKVLSDPFDEIETFAWHAGVADIGPDSLHCIFNFGPWTLVGYRAPLICWMMNGAVAIDQRPDLCSALRLPGLTYATVTPRMLAALLAAPEDAYPRQPQMTLAIVAGTVTAAEIDLARARITSKLFNGHGATETDMTGYTPLVTPDDYRWQRIAPGRLVQVVDDDGHEVPPGEVGLLRVSTRGQASGYLGDEATTRAFFHDGFFYPGDLAVTREDGRFALQGRITAVINVAGDKLSPEPIEDGLRQTFDLAGACLFSAPDEHGEERLHLVIESPTPVDLDRLRAYLSSQFPVMPPTYVVQVTALPRNAMGKIMRRTVKTQALAAVQASKR
jgi:acyl-coenzyme A synthetase/AMP-(fatty) acid ligase